MSQRWWRSVREAIPPRTAKTYPYSLGKMMDDITEHDVLVSSYVKLAVKEERSRLVDKV